MPCSFLLQVFALLWVVLLSRPSYSHRHRAANDNAMLDLVFFCSVVLYFVMGGDVNVTRVCGRDVCLRLVLLATPSLRLTPLQPLI